MDYRRKLRAKMTFANVVSVIALFLALGGTAFAASHLGKNTVGPKQLKKNSVRTAKIKNSAVTGAKVKDGSLTGSDLADGTITGTKVADGSLTGADINQTSLTSVRASNVIGVALNSNCTAALPFPSGVSAAQDGGGCRVTFSSNVLNCVATATAAIRTRLFVLSGDRTVFLLRNTELPNVIFTEPYFNGSVNPLPVDLSLDC
jgi:uncharacterized protein YjbI with pentapeptide repeats